jgi:hypothetical protein
MGLFKTLTTLLSPKKAEFAKRLISKRRAGAEERLISGIAVEGSAEYRLRTLGLESTEYAATPEATLVNILEQYWQPHIANFYTIPSLFGGPYEPKRGASPQEIKALAMKRVNDLAGNIEYKLTGNPKAAATIPEFTKFIDYMRYRIAVEHPKNPYLGSQYGYTDAFFEYALEESRHVFSRQ